MADPSNDPPEYFDPMDDESDDDTEDGLEECGMMPDGQCTLAGTEWCDWHCPLNGH